MSWSRSLFRTGGARIAALLLLVGAGPMSQPLAAQRGRKAAPPAAAAPSGVVLDSTTVAQMKYRYIGPEGNRVTSVTGVPGDPMTYYAGAASGGLWKSTDGGIHWSAVFDAQPVSSIGALAVATSDHNVVWAGTGEPFIRSHISLGWGVFKSTDAGKTWTKMGLDNTGRIARVVIHPTNPDIVYVASEGTMYGPQPDRGIFRTMDGGKTWEKVLFVNDSTGASDLVMDPNNPRILYAGMWQGEIHTWGRISGGAGSGIWMSRDGGTTWQRLTGNGLPTKPVGKIGLGISKANANRIYALIETGDGVPAVNVAEPDRGRLFRSDDGGEHWTMVSEDRQVAGRTHYYNRMGVEPDDPDAAYFLAANWSKTLDGGRTIIDPPFSETPGGDHHDIWIDPTNGDRMIVSHDGGLSISTNRTKSWLRVQLPLAQMYHVTVDDRIPYMVYGNRQDGPSAMGPSNTKFGFGDGAITRGMWHAVGGGESGWATPDPVDTNLVWSSASGSGSVGGIVTRYDIRTGITRSVEIWPEGTIGHAANDVKYRFVWTLPLTISPNDHNRIYAGSQFVHVTTDGGKSWQVISPDLTRNDRSHMGPSGGLTPDNIGVEYSGVVHAIAESRMKAGLIWAGTNDGKVQLTQDAGAHWTDVTANLPGLPVWGTVSSIEPSRYAEGTAYLSVDGHQADTRDPWIWRTADYGKTWTLITRGIPKSPLSYVHVVKEDPVTRGLLYAGTENGLYVSFNDGADWQPLQNNLPHAPVYGIQIQERFNDLVVATYGRGFWILDDITPLRGLTAAAMAKDADLFAPRNAYRFLNVEAPFAVDYDPSAGNDPPYGADLNYWMKTAGTDSVTLTIADAAGKVVRTMKGPAKAGVNRAWWDLRSDRTKEAKLRTWPLYAPELRYPAEGKSAPQLGRINWLVNPGTYTVSLTAGGRTMTQPLTVLKDPKSGGSEEGIRAQNAFIASVAAAADSAVDMINALETVRLQVATVKASLSDTANTADVRRAADTLDRALADVEGELIQLRVTGRGQDILRWPMMLAEQLEYLAGAVTGSDEAPTTQAGEVQAVLRQRLTTVRSRYDQVMAREVQSFRTLVRQKGLANLIM